MRALAGREMTFVEAVRYALERMGLPREEVEELARAAEGVLKLYGSVLHVEPLLKARFVPTSVEPRAVEFRAVGDTFTFCYKRDHDTYLIIDEVRGLRVERLERIPPDYVVRVSGRWYSFGRRPYQFTSAPYSYPIDLRTGSLGPPTYYGFDGTVWEAARELLERAAGDPRVVAAVMIGLGG